MGDKERAINQLIDDLIALARRCGYVESTTLGREDFMAEILTNAEDDVTQAREALRKAINNGR